MKKKFLVFLFLIMLIIFPFKVDGYTSTEIGKTIASYAEYVVDNNKSDFIYILPSEYYHINQTYLGKKSYNGKYGADCNAFVGFVICNATNLNCKQVAYPYSSIGKWIINDANGWGTYFEEKFSKISYSELKNKVNNSELKAGDLVTSCVDNCSTGTHIQIYIGNGMFVDNGGSSVNVRKYDVNSVIHRSRVNVTYTTFRAKDANINLDKIYYPTGDGNKTDITNKLNLSFLKKENNVQTPQETIFIGDSRTYGMVINGVISKSNSVYGSGYGYKWFIGNGTFSSKNTNYTNGGINGANSIMNSGKNYNIVIWLGVNDYKTYSANSYYSQFLNLASNSWKNHDIYIVSVGPVDDNKTIYVDNASINQFNSSMKSLINNSGLNNLHYIDLGYNQNSITYYDGEGLHYGKTDYQNIFNKINSSIDLIQKEEQNQQGNYDENQEQDENNNGGQLIISNEPLECEDLISPELQEIIQELYSWFEFIAISLVIILGMLDFGKSVTSDDKDLLKKATKRFATRLIVLVIILLLPVIIKPVLSVFLGEDSGICGFE